MNDANKEIMSEIGKQMNCRDCGNWLCGANGADQEVVCFIGFIEEGGKKHGTVPDSRCD